MKTFINGLVKFGYRRLLIIDRENEPNAFYGGIFQGQSQLKGYTKTLQLQLKGETEQGTSIVIPYDEDYTVADVSFIDFVDKNRLKKWWKPKRFYWKTQGLRNAI